jgi:hypothetical protein
VNEFKAFFRTRWVELLIAGVWLQSVISAAFTGSLALLAITTLGGLALLALIFWLVGRVRGRRRPDYGPNEAFVVPRRALICTVGKQKETALFSLSRQRPEWLGLICTRQSEDVAGEIEAASELDAQHVRKEIVDPWSVAEVRAKTAFLLDWLARHGVPPAEVAVDITGGTSIMTASAFSMACERQVDCQYVRSEYDADNRPIRGTQRGVFVTRYDRPGPLETRTRIPTQ